MAISWHAPLRRGTSLDAPLGRRLGTSPAQFYRVLDTTNYRKSVDKRLALLQVLGCEVDFIVRDKSA